MDATEAADVVEALDLKGVPGEIVEARAREPPWDDQEKDEGEGWVSICDIGKW